MNKNLLVRWATVCTLSAMTLTLTGCGGSSIGAVPVSGTVTVDGSPMEGVLLFFNPDSQGGQAASGKTDADGVFHLTTLEYRDGAIPGAYKVTISKRENEDDGLPKDVDPSDSASMDAIYGQLDTKKKTKSFNAVAEKFAQAATSGITAEVTKGGDNSSFEWDVEAGKKKR